MARYIPYDYSQRTLVATNFEEQILPGTFEYALHFLISERIDLSVFDECYKNDETGRAAYDPAILLKIILYAYYKGITSSRQIENCCRQNIIFMALSCDTAPDHSTIARFVSGHPAQIQSIFEQLVLVCHEEGLIGHELIAIDGCKLPSNAAKEWSGTFKELEEKKVAIRRRIDKLMTAHRVQDGNGSDEAEQRANREKTISTLNKAHDRIERFLSTESPRQGKSVKKTEVKSNITDNESCKMTTSKGTIQGYNGIAAADAAHQIIIEAKAYGEGQEHHTLVPTLKAIEERYRQGGVSPAIYATGIKVTADTGYAKESNIEYVKRQGINAYIPDNKFRERDKRFDEQKNKYGSVERAKRKTAVTYQAEDFQIDVQAKRCVCPAGVSLRLHSERKDKLGNDKLFFQGKTSVCRQCDHKKACMRNPKGADTRTGHGRQVSFVVKHSENKSPYTRWMMQRVDSEQGKQVYTHRMAVIEPVFGNLEANKGLRRFSLRGQEKVNAQWLLYCSVHNIEKIGGYGESFTEAKKQYEAA